MKKNIQLVSYASIAIYTIGILFTTIVIWRNTLQTPYSLNWNGWAYYEWLINYEGGFVRRGLVGSFINEFYYGKEVVAVNTLVFISAFLFTLLATLLVASNLMVPRSALLFVFCPVGLYWAAIGNEYYYRKEIFFYIVMLSVCLIFQRWQRCGNRYLAQLLVGLIFLSSIFLPLVHEAFIFYSLLLFALILFKIYQSTSMSERKVVLLYSLFCSLLFAILSYFKGDVGVSQSIWLSLSDSARDLSGSLEPAGGISAIGWSLAKGLNLSVVALLSGLASYYLFPIFLIYLFIGYMVSETRELRLPEAYFSKELFLPYCLVIISFIPLFVLGWDWGRWVMGIWYVSLCIFLLRLDAQIIQFLSNEVSSVKKLAGILAFPTLLFLGIVTRVPECCISGSGSSFLYNPALEPIKDFLRDSLK